jgi:hypothetical protein
LIVRTRVSFSLAVLALLAAAPAQAQQQPAQAQKALPVAGNTPQVCMVQDGQAQAGELINFRGTDGDSLRVLQLLDPSTLAARGARATLDIAAVCNFPHRIRLESQNTGLWPLEGPLASENPDFATALPYRARLEWADRSGELEADAKVRRTSDWRADIDEPAAGDMTLAIEIDEGASNTQIGAPVLAGAYGDTLRIFLEPR